MRLADITKVCCLGTGGMGFGTALLFALHGYSVNMFGRSRTSLDRAFANIRDALDFYKTHDLVTDEDIRHTLGRITACTSYAEAVSGAQFAMESVVEDLAVKQDLFAMLEGLAGKACIFASNTSGLSPTAIAAKLRHPERFVVAHFWNPPHLLPLVEVVPGARTAPQSVEITREVLKSLGKCPVVLQREAPGFIGNRLQFAMLREAFHIIEQGIASPEAVDACVRHSFSRRLCVTGPLESADFGGLDTFLQISSYLNADLSDAKQPSKLLEDAVAAGRLGTKTGKGFYDWTPEDLARVKHKRDASLITWLRQDRMER